MNVLPLITFQFSSRSHLVYELVIDSDMDGRRLITFADLAGNEPSAVSPDIELTNYVNTSLLTLTRVLNARKACLKNIPYRDSSLTQCLRVSINGASQITLIAHVNGKPDSMANDIYTMGLVKEISAKTQKH